MIVERLGEPWAAEWFGKVFSYMTEGFPLKKYGSPLWIDYADRKLGLDISKYARAEIFHQPRHLMLNILALERMIKTG